MPSQSFTNAAQWSTFNVPTDVERITVTVVGGGSGGSGGNKSGRVVGDLLVKDTWVLQLFVGEGGAASNGSTGGTGGMGGGARGADGHQGLAGGNGGGGASYIRVNTKDGTLKVVAGGAGGDSGDSGTGGAGGGSDASQGHLGTSGTAPVGAATGGTQNQGGNGGTSSAGTQYDGSDAAASILGSGGRGGGSNSNVRSHGGGGGGGGYHGGGGGAASAAGYAPGGGGGGGSNYVGGLTNLDTNGNGTGVVGDGSITLSWAPVAKNNPPSPPTAVMLNGMDVSDSMHTKITSSPSVSAVVNDPDNDPAHPTDLTKGDQVRILVYWSDQENFSNRKGPRQSPLQQRTKRAVSDMVNLVQNTRYWVRVYAEDNHGMRSTNYAGFSFYTNESAPPDHLTVNGGGSGVTIQSIDSATFAWQFNDPDQGDLQQGFHIRYRPTASSTSAPGAFTDLKKDNTHDNLSPVAGPPASSRNQWVFDPAVTAPNTIFKGNTYYEWQVRTVDQQGQWSEWSLMFKFFSAATSTPPVLLSPIGALAVDATKSVTLSWKFIDPDPNDTQSKADVRWQTVSQSVPPGLSDPDIDNDTAWTVVLGTTTLPGSAKTWTFAPGTFTSGYQYRWEVRTYDSLSHASTWSSPASFWAIGTVGSLAGPPAIPELAAAQGSLGCGEYRVFIYQQGGDRIIGEVHSVNAMQFNRVRDDISVCSVTTNGLGDADCCEFYATIRCWMHEIVVFRSGVRVWEGPITRITYTTHDVTFEARDVMVYVYRRIMRQGYNDAYRIIERNPNGTVKTSAGVYPVIDRAQSIITNALAPHDPNVLPYLTTITAPGDARQTNVRPDWSTTAWEEVDGLAATAGLDYTVVGRRIILWDTHTPIGRLPTMTDGDFSDSPIVSEYGMQTATYLAVSNGSGVAGGVSVENAHRPPGTATDYPYGPIEMLASQYGAAASAPTEALTQAGLAEMVAALKEQATRNIAGRFPSPLVVRVPDNSSLSPECGVGFQQLVPGVWLPLRATGTCRAVTQWQKLDSVTVNVDGEAGEKVQVVLSPAPKGGVDPDSDPTDSED